MRSRIRRRTFLQSSAVAGIGFWVAGGVSLAESKSPNEKVRIACVGVNGKGESDSAAARSQGEVVAVCDVDDAFLDAAAARLKGANGKEPKKFVDFRKMLDAMEKSIDAVTVSTPDHCHAVAAVMAMRMGKHAFVQKPLTHTIHEARVMGEIAREKKVATQMGNQYTADEKLRKAAAFLRSGGLGKVGEVHVWTNRPIWPQGVPRPAPEKPPKQLHWDLWLGPAPERPYTPLYHPFKWRGWWDFGTGALGDMACHTVNMPFMGLDLRNPTSVVAKSSGHNRDSYPNWSVIEFDFPANDWRPALKMFWYDGGKRPDMALFSGLLKESEAKPKGKAKGKGKARKEREKPNISGCIVVGEKGKLYAPGDYAQDFVTTGVQVPKEIEFVQSPGHFQEWIRAIKGGPAAMSNFPDYAGPLVEVILLGNLSVWTADKAEKTADGAEVAQGKKIEWDAKNLQATNAPEVAHVIKAPYRAGYSL